MNSRDIELLRAALDLPESGRAAFLARACGDDAALHARVLALLALDARGDPLLDGSVDPFAAEVFAAPPETPAEAAALPDRVGERLGPWRITAHLGDGGMGSVWLAERADGAFTGKAAIKTIKPGMDSAAVLRAFQRERDLLARLEHAHIAHIIDGGIDAAGRPWFAMRHVTGEPLPTWLARKPSLEARLRLVAALCRTVAHAHRRLVLHQDIKPGNVLVQPDGTPCLLDFGIGRILSEEGDPGTRATIHRFASPGWAAPEQLAGEPVTTATDVWALGALLFEVLTGQRYNSAHGGGDSATLPSRIARQQAAPGPVPAARLRGDLDAITARALARDPARRYGGAELLAEDIERHLAGHPVHARPDGRLYRLRKWLRRNRLTGAAIALAVLALVAGLGISLWQTRVAQHEAQRATAVKDYLVGLFDAGRTNVAGTGALEQRVVDLLDASADRLHGELAQLPEVRDEIYTTLVEIYDSNDRPERSVTLAEERLAAAEQAWGPRDPRVVPALLLLAGVDFNHGDFAPMPELLDRAQAIIDAAGSRQSLEQALLWKYRGNYTLWALEQQDEGMALVERAVALLRAHHADTDEFLVALLELAMRSTQDPDKALPLIAELRDGVIRRHGPQHLFLVQADFVEARALGNGGRYEAALERLRAGAARIEHFIGPWHHDVFTFRLQEMSFLLRLGRVQDAEALWQQWEAARREHNGDDPQLQRLFELRREQIDAARTEPAGGA